MKLFLCSEFITEETKPDFEKLIGRNMQGLNIACIITAAMGYKSIVEARGDVWDLSWLAKDVARAENVFKCKIDKYDFNDMTALERSNLFDKYDGIWVEGGMTGYLLKSIQDYGLRELLVRFAKEKFYIGTSAGSMVCAKSQDASEWFIGEPEEGVSKYEGLGLIPFQFYPHFSEENLPNILEARHSDQEYWLLQDGQAVAFNGKTYKVCGGGITIIKKE